MLRATDTLDPQTRHEVLATVVMLAAVFEQAAQQVDALFPHADPQTRQELIGIAGRELAQGAALGLEYDETRDNVAEGCVANMLKAACRP